MKIPMCEVYSKYKRKQTNIEKAIFNDEVNTYFQQHYRYLHSLLVKTEEDEDTFNDTFLKLTYNYNSEKDFIEQYKYYFNLLKGAYNRADKVEKYHLGTIEGMDIADRIDEELPSKDKIKFSDIKTNIHNALAKETRKGAKKTGK